MKKLTIVLLTVATLGLSACATGQKSPCACNGWEYINHTVHTS